MELNERRDFGKSLVSDVNVDVDVGADDDGGADDDVSADADVGADVDVSADANVGADADADVDDDVSADLCLDGCCMSSLQTHGLDLRHALSSAVELFLRLDHLRHFLLFQLKQGAKGLRGRMYDV